MESSQKDTFVDRYALFLDYFGLTPNSLAKALGDSGKVKYHNYKTGEAEPNTKTLALIATHYPVNTDWLVAGIGSMLREERDASVEGDGIDWKKRCLEMESKFNQVIAGMTERYDTLMSKYESLLEKTVRKLDPTLFKESDSQFTAIPMTRRLISMGRHDSPVTECKVIQHPATAQLASVRVLDSRVVRIGA